MSSWLWPLAILTKLIPMASVGMVRLMGMASLVSQVSLVGLASLVSLVSLVGLVSLVPSARADASAASLSEAALRKLPADLIEHLGNPGHEGQIPFIAVLTEQSDPLPLMLSARGITHERGADAGRAYVTDELRDIAASTQGPLLDYLAEWQAAGQVARYRGLWIANMIVGRATPDVIIELAGYPEVDRILANQAVDVDEQTSEFIPESGRRMLAAADVPETDRTEVGYHLDRIGVPQAWSSGYYGNGVVVAVIDTGVDYTHPDLADHMWINDDEIPWNGIDDDFNGFVDDTLGWNFLAGTNDPMGSGTNDHGTRAAGLVAGDGTSGIATGVAPEATIMPLRAAGGEWSLIFEAMQYAIDNGAHIISMSLSQKWYFSPKPDYALWRQVTDNELAAGVLHANSAGNEGDEFHLAPVPFNVGAPGVCPSAWVSPDQYVTGGVSAVITVGAIDSLEILADYSSRGPCTWEDIASVWPAYPHAMPEEYRDYPYSDSSGGLIKPDVLTLGDNVYSTRLGGGYMTFSGTSAACPQAAGVMALLLDAVPELTPDQVAMVLQLAADDWGPPGKDNNYGAGVLNVPKALQLAQSLDVLASISGVVSDAATGDSLPGATVTVLGVNTEDETNSEGYYELLANPGLVSLEARAFGYLPDTVFVSLEPGAVYTWDAALDAWPTGTVSGVITDAFSNEPIAGARVDLVDTPAPSVYTDAAGVYVFEDFPAGTEHVLRAVRFGNLVTEGVVQVEDDSAAVLDLVMEHGVFDDFEIDQGWIIGAPDDTATVGIWERGDPVGTYDFGVPVQPEDDHTPGDGVTCFLTQNGEPGSGPDQNDVDGGRTTLTSPLFDGSWYHDPVCSFWYWYSNDTGIFVDDTLRVEATNNDGASWHPLVHFVFTSNEWTLVEIDVINAIHLSDSMRVRFIAADWGGVSTVEAAIDDFAFTGAAYADADDPVADVRVMRFHGARPNPLPPGGGLHFQLAQPAEVELEIFDPAGRLIRRFPLGTVALGTHSVRWDGTDRHGQPCPAGAYFARLATPASRQTQRLILVR